MSKPQASPSKLPPLSLPPGLAPPPPIPTDPLSDLSITSKQISGNDACIKRLKELNLRPGEKIYPSPKPPCTAGVEVDVQTNLFGIEVHKQQEIFQYTLNIKAALTPSKEVVFTKKGKEEFVALDRVKKCCEIFHHILIKNKDTFRTGSSTYVYDAQSMLYSTINIFASEGGSKKSIYFEINGSEIENEDLKKFKTLKVEISATKNPSIKFSQEDVGRRSTASRIDCIHRGYHQILDLALNQKCIKESSEYAVFENGKVFFLKPLEKGFWQEDCVEVGDGKQMMPGIKKTVHFVEGPFGRGENNPSVVIDGMKVAFHKKQLLIDKLTEIISKNIENGLNDFERDRCTAIIKGLSCSPIYLKRTVHLKIEGIHHEGSTKSRFQLNDGGSTSVFDYFKKRYNIVLQYPNAHLIICNVSGKQHLYPMELLIVSPNQRVKTSQQTSQQSQRSTKESVVLPDARQRLIMTGKRAAGINAENPVLNGLGVVVMEEPLMVKGRQLPPVRISSQSAGAAISQNFSNNKWRVDRYSRPATPPAMWDLYCVGNNKTRFTLEKLKIFHNEYVKIFKSKGVAMPPAAEVRLIVVSEIEKKLEHAAERGCKFVLTITDDSMDWLHNKYKAIEKTKAMIIQDMRVKSADDVISKRKIVTLENIVNKSNVKLGGTNYVYYDVENELSNTLVIGISVSIPPPGNKFCINEGKMNPSFIGYANNGKNSQEFSGDFLLTESRLEAISEVEQIFSDSIQSYQKGHDGQSPKRIILFRTGVSEGDHGSIMAYEIPLALSAANKFSENIKVVYTIVSKEHSYRFFKKNLNELADPSRYQNINSRRGTRPHMQTSGPKACDLNVGPGLIIDTGVTNPARNQFFLNSHTTLQGTAKTPLYTVLYDDTGASINTLEKLTFQLCHLHQIVGLTTSLPTPLYVANEYAKRGKNLYNELCQETPPQINDDLPQLSRLINYKSVDMADRRITA